MMIITIIIMDGSCIVQIFPSRKLNALAHTIHANIHRHNLPLPTHKHIIVCLDLWKCLLKTESFMSVSDPVTHNQIHHIHNLTPLVTNICFELLL